MARMIIVEGVDGVGKSTFLSTLENRYKDLSLSTTHRFFPYQMPPPDVSSCSIREVLYYLKDFERQLAEHPTVNTDVILCDRSFLTTMVYQGFIGTAIKGRYYEPIQTLGEDLFASKIDVDHIDVVYLECSTETSINRISARKSSKDVTDNLKGDELTKRLDNLKNRFEIVISDTNFKWKMERLSLGLARKKPSVIKRIHQLDTTNSSPEDTVTKALQLIRSVTQE